MNTMNVRCFSRWSTHRVRSVAVLAVALSICPTMPRFDWNGARGAISAAYADGAPESAAAKTFFKSVSDKQYDAAWKLLTKKSQDVIIKAVAASDKADPKKIHDMFAKNDSAVQNGFWESFRVSSRADQVAAAEMKLVSSDKKSAKVSYVKTSNLLMFNEGGWKFGLVETFYPDGYTQQ